jgi:hypothetical protein
MRHSGLFISGFLLSFINLSGTPEMRVETFPYGTGQRLEWEGLSGVTYTCFVETSLNLSDWTYLPTIHHGTDVFDIGYSVSSGEKLFFCIQYLGHPTGAVVDKDADDFDGDGIGNLDEITMSPVQGDPLDASSHDGDSMPDDWENAYGLDSTSDDSTEDPDQDGFTNLEESQLGSSPIDFFNGQQPLITILRGAQDVGVDDFSNWPFDVLISNGQGTYLANAPVTFEVLSGYSGLAAESDPQAQTTASLTLRANPLGRIHPAFSPVYFKGGPSVGSQQTINVIAGNAQASFDINVITSPANSFSEPRQLERVENADGSTTYSWTGSPMTADTFFIEEQDSHGDWMRVYDVSTSALPAPDPVTGVYTITIGY